MIFFEKNFSLQKSKKPRFNVCIKSKSVLSIDYQIISCLKWIK